MDFNKARVTSTVAERATAARGVKYSWLNCYQFIIEIAMLSFDGAAKTS